MKKKKGTFIFYLILITVLVLFDQYTKHLAVLHLTSGSDMDFIPGVLGLTYLENRGAAFGVLSGRLKPVILLTPLITVAIFWLIVKIPDDKKYLALKLICAFFIAGGLGNFIDRVRLGYVVDFFEFLFIDFPIFNVADIFLTVSSILMLILVLFYYKNEDWEYIKENIR